MELQLKFDTNCQADPSRQPGSPAKTMSRRSRVSAVRFFFGFTDPEQHPAVAWKCDSCLCRNDDIKG